MELSAERKEGTLAPSETDDEWSRRKKGQSVTSEYNGQRICDKGTSKLYVWSNWT